MIKILLLLPLLTACSYHSTMGVGDRFQVDSTASLFAPSVTTVTDTKFDVVNTYAGPSIVGQAAQAAGTTAGGYLLGNGIARSGTTIGVDNKNTPIAGGGAGGNAAAAASTTQGQSQLQLQAIQ